MSAVRRLFLLAALLCVFGVQFVETTHAHSVDDSAVSCQLCSGASDTTLDRIISAEFTAQVSQSQPPRTLAAPRSATIFAFLSRGPPLNF